MAADPVHQLAQALGAVDPLLAAIRAEQWADSTPCQDWTVRQLVNHLVAGNQLFVDILGGAHMLPLAELRAAGDRDRLGDAPAATYRASAEALLSAFRRPAVLAAMFTIPIGTVPGIAALQMRIVETLVHGWDLARATGQPAQFPEDLAEQALAFSREKLADLPPGRTPFGPPQPVADEAAAIDRLAALLGRDVTGRS